MQSLRGIASSALLVVIVRGAADFDARNLLQQGVVAAAHKAEVAPTAVAQEAPPARVQACVVDMPPEPNTTKLYVEEAEAEIASNATTQRTAPAKKAACPWETPAEPEPATNTTEAQGDEDDIETEDLHFLTQLPNRLRAFAVSIVGFGILRLDVGHAMLLGA
uniref:Solute carrier family 40 protein n=1 Tax=Alexandrium catenella TaxID=2925 RepID=A0A7S1WGN0_ALECA|mmetsp:Transcript_59482/g.159319  ORF Transcript_59482/g.159319 Transcript_59482/m.159319 type:complete len:163 (+) Transcript_59482:127-615(+)